MRYLSSKSSRPLSPKKKTLWKMSFKHYLRTNSRSNLEPTYKATNRAAVNSVIVLLSMINKVKELLRVVVDQTRWTTQ
jgi:hypothetical protein